MREECVLSVLFAPPTVNRKPSVDPRLFTTPGGVTHVIERMITVRHQPCDMSKAQSLLLAETVR